MHRSTRTAQIIRPSRSFSSTIEPATGQAAWQMEHANAPKHRSGSTTAMVLGAFFHGPVIILVHMVVVIIPEWSMVDGRWAMVDGRRPSDDYRPWTIDHALSTID